LGSRFRGVRGVEGSACCHGIPQWLGPQESDFSCGVGGLGGRSRDVRQYPVQKASQFFVVYGCLGDTGHATEVGSPGLCSKQRSDLTQVRCNSRDAATVVAMTTRAMKHVAFELWAKVLGVGGRRNADGQYREEHCLTKAERAKAAAHFSGWRSVACPTTTAIEQL